MDFEPPPDVPRVTPPALRNPFDVAGQKVFIRSSEDLSPLRDNSVDLIVTSPPYWNLKDYGVAGQIGREGYDEYLSRMNAVWTECFRTAKPDAVLAINVGNRRHKKRFYPIGLDIAARMEGWILWDILIWYIPNALPQPNHYMERLLDNKFEFVLIFTKDGSSTYKFHKPRVPQKYADADPRSAKRNALGRCVGNVIRIPAYKPPNVKKLGYHVAAYPEELAAFLIECYSDPGDVVLDPFVGSGTTLKVCRGMNRSGVGVELNEEFAHLIHERTMETFQLPDWRDIDIIHSATNVTGRRSPRKVHLLRQTSTSAPGAPSTQLKF